jgi:hypothetical protein
MMSLDSGGFRPNDRSQGALDLGEEHEGRLLDAMQGERRLLHTLLEILRRQRAGVAGDDLELLEGSVYDAQRVLGTLAQARRRRRALISLLTGDPETPMDQLEGYLGARLTPELEEARRGLRSEALSLRRELAINRRVLESASDAGEGFLRLLQGGTRAPATYAPGTGDGPGGSGGGTLFNRTI